MPKNSDPYGLGNSDPRKHSIKSNARNEMRLKIGKLANNTVETEVSDNQQATDQPMLTTEVSEPDL